MVGGGATSDYWAQRDKILKTEKLATTCSAVKLTDKENEINKVLLDMKHKEIKAGIENSKAFLPRLHFFEAKPSIENSDVFKFIQRIPKGGSLHTHLTAAVSFDYLYKYIVSSKNIYANIIDGRFKLKFLNESNVDNGWTLVSDLANGDKLRNELTLEVDNPREKYPSIEDIWKKFMSLFSATYDLYSFKPFFEEIVYQVLKELVEDNVYYAEFRAAYLPLYDLDGTKYPFRQFCASFHTAVSKFKADYPSFLDARLIISPSRRLDNDSMQEAIQIYKDLKTEFPQVVAGFDLIGFEELGRPLIDIIDLLLPLKTYTKFFFHAGETNWLGTETDTNLLDAVLLGSSRIGHAFSLVKHPEILKYVSLSDIAIEITPISNQVLMLVDDLRNHPAASLISQGIPIVICNDDPSFWGASGLSYDWYLVFMAMTHKDAGLEILKLFATNSIKYSAMSEAEKPIALQKWEKQWKQFIDDKVKEYNIAI